MNKLNYLLVMPRFVSTGGTAYAFSLGIAYISAIMKESGFNVFNLNLNHAEGEIEEIIKNEVAKRKINVMMTGGLSAEYSSLKFIVDCVYNSFPQVKIIIGGGIITAEPETAMIALEHADFGVVGEGEITVVELCSAMQQSLEEQKPVSFSEINGIIYKDNGKWIQTKVREGVKDLDSLPFPDYDGFEFGKFLELPPENADDKSKYRAAYVLGSRSCPYSCTFCFSTMGNRYRNRSLDNLAKEIEMLVDKYDVKNIKLAEELFSRDKDRVQAFDRISKRFDITWTANLRVDNIDEELIEILQHSNCSTMLLGLESADNSVLKSMRKGITVEQIDNALKLAYTAGIPVTGNFIFGDIEETIETAENTLNYWENHDEYNIKLFFIKVYPGTYLYKYALSNKIIKDPVQFLRDGCPNINVSKLSNEELSYITKRMFRLTGKQNELLKNSVVLSTENIRDGVMSLKGQCVKCGRENIWENVEIFVVAGRVNCFFCGQKHITPFPDSLKSDLLDSISQISSNLSKLGLWGIYRNTFALFEDNHFFMNDKFIFIDNSYQMHTIRIHDKKVYSPATVLTDEIDTVIFFYPQYYAFISKQVKRKYPNVKHFINVCDLLV